MHYGAIISSNKNGWFFFSAPLLPVNILIFCFFQWNLCAYTCLWENIHFSELHSIKTNLTNSQSNCRLEDKERKRGKKLQYLALMQFLLCWNKRATKKTTKKTTSNCFIYEFFFIFCSILITFCCSHFAAFNGSWYIRFFKKKLLFSQYVCLFHSELCFQFDLM